MALTAEELVRTVENIKKKKAIDKAMAENATLLSSLGRDRLYKIDSDAAARKVAAKTNERLIAKFREHL